MKRVFLSIVLAAFAVICSAGFSLAADRGLLIFAGAASKPAIEEIASAFQKKTGIKIELNIGGSGILLSQMKLTQKGDIYFPGSVDFIEKAKKENLISETSEIPIVYLVPAINVKKGNPRKIKNLFDLCAPGLKVVIANPETVCLGVFAAELAEKNFNSEQNAAFRKNIINYVESCEKTANAISLSDIDAVIGWSVFENWDPARIETVKIDPDRIIRLSYLSAAVTKCSKNPQLAKELIDFMKSPEGLECFKKYGYFTTAEEALKYTGKTKPVGGDAYTVPPEWMFNK